MRITKVFTGKGDEGFSSYWKNKRLRKDSPIFHTLGDIDETIAILGLANYYSHESLKKEIEYVQKLLFLANADLVIPEVEKGPRIKEKYLKELEEKIEKLNEELGNLKEFLIPSGNLCALFLHLARTVTRRAERSAVKLFDEFPQSKRVLKLLNRISDYLFLLARKSNKLEGVNEKLITSFEP